MEEETYISNCLKENHSRFCANCKEKPIECGCDRAKRARIMRSLLKECVKQSKLTRGCVKDITKVIGDLVSPRISMNTPISRKFIETNFSLSAAQ